MKLKNGVTMLVLVITIVVLLILAGVTLSFVIGENGLLSQTKSASLKSKEDVALEDVGEAWASLDSDYWEDLTNNALVSRGDYFNEESLNRLLKGKGKVTNLNYNENGESGFDYTTDSGNETYSMVVDENGDIRLGKANLSTGDGDNNNNGNEGENIKGNYIYARLLNVGDENYELQLSGDKDFSNSYSNLDIVQDFGNVGNNGYKFSKLSSLSASENNLFKDLGAINKNYYGLYIRNGGLSYYEPLDSKYSINKGNLPWYSYVEKIEKVTIVNQIKPGNTDNWFLGMKNLTNIEGLKNLDTSEAASMKSMFEGCEKIIELDLSNFVTSKVEDMSSMFRNTRALKNLNLTSFNTSKVKDMSYMFMNCSNNGSMEVLDLKSFDTSNVKKYEYMFYESGKEGDAETHTAGQGKITVSKRLEFKYIFKWYYIS